MLKSYTRLVSFFLIMVCSLSLVGRTVLGDVVTGNSGGGQPHSNMQPSLAMNYIIALQGTFPSRNSGSDPALGEISIFAGNFAPRGWAKCEGQLLPISQNSALFSLLGTNYGGDGRTTFALPDLRGRTPIGWGQGAGLTSRTIGQKGGSATVSLNSSEIPSHEHSLPGTTSITGVTGGGVAHDNMQPWLAITYVVSQTGIFPSRSLGGDSFLGSVDMFAGNFAPRGTSLAQGQLQAISQNTALFSLVGTTYGGDGRTTFGLPDLQGRTAVHAGTGPGLDQYRLGDRKGAETVALNTTQLPAHDHTLPGSASNTGATGGGQSHANLQPGLGLNYVIATQGVYPSRNFGGSEPFIAEVGIFAGNFAPRGWAFCDGQLLPISQNEALFSLVGTIYGGDGRTTFALPDLRGRSVIGDGTGPGLPTYRIGQRVGDQDVTLAETSMAVHSHALPTITWAGEEGGAWHTASNWSLNEKPIGVHKAHLNNGNTAVLSQSGEQCLGVFLGYDVGDVGKLRILQGASLSVTGGSYIGFGGSGTLDVASGGQITSDTMFIASGSSLRLHVGGDDMVVLGSAGSTGSMANNGSVELYADAFLADGTYTPISDFDDNLLLWSGTGTVDTFGGVWQGATQTFDVSPLTALDAGVTHSVTSSDRLLITDAASGKQVSVSFGDVASGASFSASPTGDADLLNLDALLPTYWSMLGAWDFTTDLPVGDEVFLAFDVGSGLPGFQVWHLDGGVWSLVDPEFMTYDSAGGVAGFTVDSFSGYAVTVPEPGTMALLSIGALVSLRRRRRRKE